MVILLTTRGGDDADDWQNFQESPVSRNNKQDWMKNAI